MARLAGGKSDTDIAQYLENVQFPAKKDDIVHAARQSGAPNDVIACLSELPGSDYADAQEVIEAYPHLD